MFNLSCPKMVLRRAADLPEVRRGRIQDTRARRIALHILSTRMCQDKLLWKYLDLEPEQSPRPRRLFKLARGATVLSNQCPLFFLWSSEDVRGKL
jgi:hypothetical protein